MENIDITSCDISSFPKGASQRVSSTISVDFFDALSFDSESSICKDESLDEKLLGTTSIGADSWDIDLRADQVSSSEVIKTYSIYDASIGTFWSDSNGVSTYPKAYEKCQGVAQSYASKLKSRKGLDDSNKYISDHGLLFVGYSTHPHGSQSNWAQNDGAKGVLNSLNFPHYNDDQFSRTYIKSIESKAHSNGNSIPQLSPTVIQVDDSLTTHDGSDNLITITNNLITIKGTKCTADHKHNITFRTCKNCLSQASYTNQTNTVGSSCSSCADALESYHNSSCKYGAGESSAGLIRKL